MVLNGYGMKRYANLILEGKATFTQIVQSENYFLTNVDIYLPLCESYILLIVDDNDLNNNNFVVFNINLFIILMMFDQF